AAPRQLRRYPLLPRQRKRVPGGIPKEDAVEHRPETGVCRRHEEIEDAALDGQLPSKCLALHPARQLRAATRIAEEAIEAADSDREVNPEILAATQRAERDRTPHRLAEAQVRRIFGRGSRRVR